MTLRHSAGRRRRRSGSVMVEFALVTPILVSLFLGAMFFGYDFYTYNRLVEQVRIGARFASLQNYDLCSQNDPTLSCTGSQTCNVALSPSSSQMATRTVNMVLYGTSTAGTTPVVENLTSSNVVVSVGVQPGSNLPISTQVAITGYSLWSPFGRLTLTNNPAAVFPYIPGVGNVWLPDGGGGGCSD